MRRLALLLLLAGCPPKGPSTPDLPEGGPCPAGTGVYVASFVAKPGHTGWVLPLHAMAVEPSAQVKDWAPLDATAASVSGVPAPPTGDLWLVTPEAPPCHVKLGSYYAAKLVGPPANVSYGVALDGCQPPQDPRDDGGFVLATKEAPDGCVFESPRPIASRLGELDAQHQWHRPIQQTPVPPVVAAVLPAPPHPCTPPECETLWAFAEVDFGDRPIAWAGVINWMTIPDPADQCTWHAARWSGIFVPGADGKPVKLDTGEHPVALSAALVDHDGPKALVADGPGAYATFDVAHPPAKLAHAMTWMLASSEAWDAADWLGPACERPAAKPAPLPKDAKPISPY